MKKELEKALEEDRIAKESEEKMKERQKQRQKQVSFLLEKMN